jgi:hypothetical protein
MSKRPRRPAPIPASPHWLVLWTITRTTDEYAALIEAELASVRRYGHLARKLPRTLKHRLTFDTEAEARQHAGALRERHGARLIVSVTHVPRQSSLAEDGNWPLAARQIEP